MILSYIEIKINKYRNVYINLKFIFILYYYKKVINNIII